MKSYAQLKEFAKNVKFPSHGLILRKAKDNNEQVVKGIRTWKGLKEKFNLLHAAYGEVYAETDMRAMHNSTRMKVIQKAVTKLIKIIKTPCPKCSMPGFSIKKAIPGLPCSQCGLPTRSTLKYVYECQSCQFSNEEMFPNKKKYEEPTFCDFCNP